MQVIQHHPTTAVAYPRAINPGVNAAKANFEDFFIEVKQIDGMGPIEIIHQKTGLKVALQIVHTKDVSDFDNMLGKALSMHLTTQYITGDYSFFVIFSGYEGDFAKEDTDLHVRLHRLSHAICLGTSWYHGFRDKVNPDL